MPLTSEPDPPDADLVARARAGDRAAFEAIYERHHAAVFRFARAMTSSTTVAEDVVHEVFLVLMKDLTRYDESRTPLPLYLYGIARNLSRHVARRARRFVVLPEPESVTLAGDPLTDLSRARRVTLVRTAIAALPVRYREAVVLCDLHERTYEDASAILGVPIGTLRSRLHRARTMLAARLSRSSSVTGLPQARLRYFW